MPQLGETVGSRTNVFWSDVASRRRKIRRKRVALNQQRLSIAVIPVARENYWAVRVLEARSRGRTFATESKTTEQAKGEEKNRAEQSRAVWEGREGERIKRSQLVRQLLAAGSGEWGLLFFTVRVRGSCTLHAVAWSRLGCTCPWD